MKWNLETTAKVSQPAPAEVEHSEPEASDANVERYLALKSAMHRKLLDRINLSVLDKLSREQVEAEVGDIVLGLLVEEDAALNIKERQLLVGEVLDELLGLGPLEPLLADETITDILVNGHRHVFVERHGLLERTSTRFQDERHLLRIIQKIVSAVGRRVDESSPFVDARLADGSRVNAIVAPLAIDGSLLSIRKFAKKRIGMARLVELGSIPAEVASVLEAIVASRRNVLISGGTGSGKTTLLNALSSFIDEQERIVTIEDSAELQLQQEHVARLETRPANIEGRGEVGQRDLVKNALRMRPDRIIVGEVRAGEAFDMLQAMNTGHDGSMTTVHANTARDALSRIEQMIGMSGIDISATSARAQIASAINVVIQIGRQADGRRRLLSLSEIVGMEGPTITMQEIFRFKMTGRGRRRIGSRSVRSNWHPAQVPSGCRGPGHRSARGAVPALGQLGEQLIVSGEAVRFLILLAVFASVFLLMQIFLRFTVDRTSHALVVNRRLKLIASGSTREDVVAYLRKNDPLAHGDEALGIGGRLIFAFRRNLMMAAVPISFGRVLLLMGILFASVFMIIVMLAWSSNFTLGAGVVQIILAFSAAVAIGLPVLVVSFLAQRRRKKMQEQFPVALDIFVRALRSGHPIASAIDLLTQEMEDPIGSEFGLISDEVVYGADLTAALQSMAERWDLDDIRMFVVSLSVQNETGGNLAEILDNLSKVIRERAGLYMKVRALSSEGRMTGWLLTALPVLAFVILFSMNPMFYLGVASDPIFYLGFPGLIIWYFVGVVSIRKMVNLKV